MGELRVRVIMSVFNGSAWLAESVGSILGQTLTELELIAVDDGSIDDTWRHRLARLCQHTSP